MTGEYEEIKRRALVAAAKAAGTLIRKEELKRHALTADVNLPIAQGLLNEVDNLLKMTPDFEKEIKNSLEKALKEGKPILDSTVNRVIELMLESLPLAFTDTLNRMVNATKDINSLIEVINNIIRDLTKEGIFVPTLLPIEIKGNDPITLSSALKFGKRRPVTIIEFLQEPKKYGIEE
jgi:hypothetical protein